MVMSQALLRPVRRGAPASPASPTVPSAPTGVGLTGSPSNLTSTEIFVPDAPTGVTASPVANAPSAPTNVSLATVPSVPTSVGLTGQPSSVVVQEVFAPDAPTGVTLTPQSSTDPYFSDVVLLLQDSLVDESYQGQTVTASGTAALSTTSKVGSYSVHFPAAGDRLTVADDFSELHSKASDYTIEFWFQAASTSGRICLLETAAASASSGILLEINSGAIDFSVYRGVSGSFTTLSGGSVSANTWHHVAVSATTSALTLYLDGQQVATTAWSLAGSASASQANLTIGADTISVVGDLDGYMDSLRITVGHARYTSAFTPPTASFPATNGDPEFANVDLLLQDSFTDQSLSGQTVVVSGNAAASTTQVKVGTHSLYFDGSGDWATISNTAMAFGTDPFTVEFWMYWDGVVTGAPWMGVLGTHNSNTAGRYAIFMNNGGITHYIQSAFPSATSVSANTWTHIASTRDSSGVCRFFKDGVLQTSMTVTDTGNLLFPQGFRIGNEFSSGRPPFSGYLDEVRVTKGVCRYTANFTPPTQAFPN